MNEDNKKNKIYSLIIKYFDYFVLFFTLFFFFVAFNYFLKDMILEIKSIENQKYNLAKEVYGYQNSYLKRLFEARDNIDNLPKEDLEKINNILPITDNKSELFSYFDKLVKDNEMILSSIKFSNLEYVEGPKNNINVDRSISNQVSRLKIDMVINGVTYERLKLLLNAVENNLRLMDISFFNFSSLNEGELNISIIAYYEPTIE